MQIHDFSQLQRFYHAVSEDQLRSHAEEKRREAESRVPHKNSWEMDGTRPNISLKAASKGPCCLTPAASWELDTIAASAAGPALQLKALSLPSNDSEGEVEDVGPRAWASVSVQTLPPLMDITNLLPPSPPSAAWVGTADMLLGGSCPAPASVQSEAAAYRSAVQQLAWDCGHVMTYAATVQQHSDSEQQQQEFALASASPVFIDPRWNYMFICMEAAAGLGKRATYAMAAAGQNAQ